jgi:hypothetical protein
MNLFALGILIVLGLIVFVATFGVVLGRELWADIRHCWKLAKKRREMERPLTTVYRRRERSALSLGHAELRF